MITEQAIQDARKHLLEQGEYMPSILVETDQGVNLIAIAGMPEWGMERQMYFFGMGRRIAKDSPQQKLQTVTMISETWVSRAASDGSRRYEKPADDPERGEALMLIQVDLTFTPPAQDAVFMDMKRDASGKLVDAMPRRPDGKMNMNLLLRFIAGWQSAAVSDADLLRMAAMEHGPLQ